MAGSNAASDTSEDDTCDGDIKRRTRSMRPSSAPICTTSSRMAGLAVAALERPLVIVQEGGYAVDAMGGLVRAFLRGASRLPPIS